MQVIGETDRILSIKAGKAKACGIHVYCAQESLQAEIVNTVKAQKLLDFFSRVGGCKEFLAGGKINTIEARITVRRATHCHVNFLGASLPKCLDTIFGGSTANDGVFYYEETTIA
jgi:hypothetical protein